MAPSGEPSWGPLRISPSCALTSTATPSGPPRPRTRSIVRMTPASDTSRCVLIPPAGGAPLLERALRRRAAHPALRRLDRNGLPRLSSMRWRTTSSFPPSCWGTSLLMALLGCARSSSPLSRAEHSSWPVFPGQSSCTCCSIFWFSCASSRMPSISQPVVSCEPLGGEEQRDGVVPRWSRRPGG